MQEVATHSRNSDLTDIERRVLSHIDEQSWLDLTCELVPAGQPDAENPLDPDEAPAREEGGGGGSVARFIGRDGRPLAPAAWGFRHF